MKKRRNWLIEQSGLNNEIETLLTDVYPKVADWTFQNAMPSYTVLLGDYNAELVTDENHLAVEVSR